MDHQSSSLTAYKLINEPERLADASQEELKQRRTQRISSVNSAASDQGEESRHKISDVALISSQVNDLKRLLASKLEDLHSSWLVANRSAAAPTSGSVFKQSQASVGKLGSPCLKAQHCSAHVANSHCRLEDFTCVCLPQHVEYNSTSCLARKFIVC